MKKTVILFLFTFVFLAPYAAINDPEARGSITESEKEAAKDHPIVGRWEYVKTIQPDGNEVINLIATEHYYADGALLYVDVWLTPQPVNEFSDLPEDIKNNFKNGCGGIATYKIEKGNEKDRLSYKVIASSQMDHIGNSTGIDFKVEKDTLIFYAENGDQVIMKRVAEK